MSISKRERILIFAVIIIAAIGAYYMLYLKPCLDDISALNADVTVLQQEKDDAALQNAQSAQLLEDIAKMETDLALYGDTITHTFDQPPVLVYLSDTVNTYADKSTIDFERTEQTEEAGLIQRYTITVRMVATYDGLKQLIAALEDAPYLMRISELSLSTDIEVPVVNQEETADTGDDAGTDTTASTDTASSETQVDASLYKLIGVEMTLDFYCLSEPLSDDAIYSFDTPRQYGGDIFY